MRILAVDPGLRTCGFALVYVSTRLHLKLLVAHTVRTDSDLEDYERKELVAAPVLNTPDLNLIVVEEQLAAYFGAQAMGRANANSLQPVCVSEMMRGIAYARGVPFMSLTPGQIRKRLGLPPNAEKSAMWVAAELRFQTKLPLKSSEHARDAAAIALAGFNEYHAQKVGLVRR